MKIAIISVSKKGYDLSFHLKELLDKDSTIISTDIYYKDIKNTIKLLFYEYDAIIAIMASGILIRSIAPLIQSKVSDPAILNIDENGKFVISTLSGHLGGANKLTSKVAELLNALPVITTATDVNKKLGIDVLAKDLYLSIKNPKEILHFNKAILNGEEIVFLLNSSGNYDFLFDYFNKNTLEIDVSIEFTSQINTDEIHVFYKNHKLIMTIETIVMGIGCKKGKSKNDILIGVNKTLNDLNISKNRLTFLASGEVKKNEQGILDLSDELNIPVKFVDMDKLKLFTSNEIHESEFVKSKFGVGSVSEASALITAGFDSKLIYKKTPFNGVTIALAISKKD
ncbi:cobalt-precorrin 5A hydrolase [uncultured Methanobrevibacter sp.]|uniref:cobalt-precorrin 5A hydrolase n=1 Tax=uncultured Methanobrevibacter sp. TaxID=253161 RepID=UPI002616B5D0|nr:cobalt-precorrin 5A hydrolase [uncultured Methanobrevibacter sp.]